MTARRCLPPISGSSGGRVAASLHFRGSHPELRDLRVVGIDRPTYERLKAAWPDGRGLAATVPLHRGALGIPWLAAGAVQPR